MKKNTFKLTMLITTLATVGTTVVPTVAVIASTQNQSTEQTNTSMILTPQEQKKATEIEQEVIRLNNLPEEERNKEIQRNLAEAEGQTFVIGESKGLRAAASTNAKVVNGGLNFFAYNKEGVNKLANLFGRCAAANGVIATISGLMATFGPTISTKVAASILTAMATTVAAKMAKANQIARSKEQKKQAKAGIRITVTETFDITNKGINAYG